MDNSNGYAILYDFLAKHSRDPLPYAFLKAVHEDAVLVERGGRGMVYYTKWRKNG